MTGFFQQRPATRHNRRCTAHGRFEEAKSGAVHEASRARHWIDFTVRLQLMAAYGSRKLKSLAASLQSLMHEQIPLTRVTGFGIRAATLHSMATAMPFTPLNRNDKGTAFAGSLSALANVTGWALLSLLTMHARGGRPTVAIYDSRTRFLRPIAADLQARASIGVRAKIAMMEGLARTGHAKVRVTVNIAGGDSEHVAVCMDGHYFVRISR
ncbi:MAG TPA: YiiD C-terminal domain-containing protein [Steroidobacteraceae bacterium]|jgi:thioesterase domain-containing protein